jgi:hypothetical protein
VTVHVRANLHRASTPELTILLDGDNLIGWEQPHFRDRLHTECRLHSETRFLGLDARRGCSSGAEDAAAERGCPVK